MSQLGLFAPPKLTFLDGLEADEDDRYGLRYYQREAYDAIHEAWEDPDTRSTLAVMATGTGKTRLFTAIAGDFDGRVLVLAHRDELIDQARRSLESLLQEPVGLEQAGFRSGRERVVVGSVQTVYREERMERMKHLGGFGLIILDEAHHYVAPTYRKVPEYFKEALVLGVTATPDRGDERALGQVFDSVAYEFDILQGISAGYLVPIEGARVFIEEIDLSTVSTSSGDLNGKELDEAMMKGVEGIVRETLKRWPDRCGPAFFPRKRSAQYAAERFNALKPGCAVSLTEETPREERKEIIRACHRGDIQFLCNCLVATEGFDWPEADIMVGARPTKSRALAAQQAGRVTRPLPGLVDHLDGYEYADERRAAILGSAKPKAILADFVGNSGKHSLISPEDILGGNYSEAEVKAAKKKAEQSEGGDPLRHLEEARAELERMAKSVQQAKVRAQVHDFDPFRIFGMDYDSDADLARQRKYGEKPLTDAQYNLLTKRWGFERDQVKGLSKRAATRLIGAGIKRAKVGLATPKQLKILSRWGFTSPNISMERASAAMTYLKSKGWGKKGEVDPNALKRILEHKG